MAALGVTEDTPAAAMRRKRVTERFEERQRAGLQEMLAGSTGLEPAASGVTGRRSNQLNYDPELDHEYLRI